MTYDSETENGIPYIERLHKSNYRYSCVVNDLNVLQPAREKVLSGSGSVTQYSIGSRQLTRATMNATQTLALWDKLMQEKESLEGVAKPRRSYGIVLRDW